MILEPQKWHADIFGILRGAHFTFDPDPALLRVPDPPVCQSRLSSTIHKSTRSTCASLQDAWGILPRAPPSNVSGVPYLPVEHTEVAAALGLHAERWFS